MGVIKAVIDAEQKACAHYKEIIKATDGEDYVTQDLCIRLLADEEEHLVSIQWVPERIRRSVGPTTRDPVELTTVR